MTTDSKLDTREQLIELCQMLGRAFLVVSQDLRVKGEPELARRAKLYAKDQLSHYRKQKQSLEQDGAAWREK